MRRTELLQEVRKVRFEEILEIWTEKQITQEEAARMLGVSDRSFRRYLGRYRENGLDGLMDKRLIQASNRRAAVDEVMELTSHYKGRYMGWNVKHYYSMYRKTGGTRSYSWVKKELQSARLVPKSSRKGVHRKRREASALPGMMLHQDGSTHEWVPEKKWDLIVTMDDATNEHYSMFFVGQEGTESSFMGIKEVIDKRGLFSSLYTDRGSHYWTTPEPGGRVDKHNLTQFGRAMKQLGIEMIAAYSPEARGRSERAFRTHQERLPKELALNEIVTMEAANRYLKEVYIPAFNEEFSHPSRLEGSAFVPVVGLNVEDILCEQQERTVQNDNCVHFEKLKLQIPKDEYRYHYVKVRVRVHCYPDGSLSVFHGPRKIAVYDCKGRLMEEKKAA